MTSDTTPKPSSTPRPRTRGFIRRGTSSGEDSSPSPEVPVVVLRVQILSCYDSEANDRKGFSDPFVIVSLLGKQFQTPVSKHNFNPVFAPKDATFDFPIYTSLMRKLGTLEFAVRDKDVIRSNHLGLYALPIDQWFEGTAFAFDDPNNQPFFVVLNSLSTVRGTMCIKVGFIHPINSMSPLDFRRIYSALITTDKDYIGIVVLEICGAKDLPKWPHSWDMDPFVQVSIGNEVTGATPVIKHSLNPAWNEQLLIHVHGKELLPLIRLTVFSRNKFTSNDYVGEAEINIASLVERAPKKDPKTGLYPDSLPDMPELNLPLTKNPKRTYKSTPTITFRAVYRPYDALGQHKGR
ncbi:C2 domain-containing protein [Lactarius indigo]|nr:C2 domain-containing protein [Lactarius indigo]